ncbi:MAG: methyltransferase domain-containing protein, partial [Candidatus Dormibacteria bacterium]
MNFNKACELEDFADPELANIIRDINGHEIALLPDEFPGGQEHRKDWEMAMAVRALREFGALGPESVLLGVAAGSEHTLFYLTRHARQVFATDRYYAPSEWGPDAPTSMLLEPELCAPFAIDRNRLVVQHMDARDLRYPDETFDGIFSSGSIEHVGELMDVAHAAFEMGRVLKPGGILSLSTEFLLAGPPGGLGWPGRILFFSRDNLLKFIVEGSGLELVDTLTTDVSPATLGTQRDIAIAIESRSARREEREALPAFEHRTWDYPHLVMLASGYCFCSVHLALRKPTGYPVTDNEWARPTTAVRDAVRAYNLAQLRQGAGQPANSGGGPAEEQVASSAPPSVGPAATDVLPS